MGQCIAVLCRGAEIRKHLFGICGSAADPEVLKQKDKKLGFGISVVCILSISFKNRDRVGLQHIGSEGDEFSYRIMIDIIVGERFFDRGDRDIALRTAERHCFDRSFRHLRLGICTDFFFARLHRLHFAFLSPGLKREQISHNGDRQDQDDYRQNNIDRTRFFFGLRGRLTENRPA